MSDGVRCPVEAGALPVPDADHPVHGALVVRELYLSAPDGGGGEFLVDPRAQVHLVVLAQARDRCEQAVEPAEGRPLIARHEDRGVPATRDVACVLLDQRPRDRLDPVRRARSSPTSYFASSR